MHQEPVPPTPDIRSIYPARIAAGIIAAYVTLTGCSSPDSPSQERADTSFSQPAGPSTGTQSAPSTSSPEGTSNPESQDLHNPVLAARAAQIISTFENSTLDVQYGYAEDIHDGRGITAGRAGFCTGADCGGDLLDVVKLYSKKKPGNPLEHFIPALETVEQEDTTKGLEGLIPTWKSVGNDPQFRAAQDAVFSKIYLDPALRYAEQAGATSAAGQLIFTDTIIQHGEGDANEDPDGLPAMFNEAMKKLGPIHGNEKQWLDGFLEIRRNHLMHAADPATRAGWREAVSRVDALEQIIASGNLSLRGPLKWTVYGGTFTLPAA